MQLTNGKTDRKKLTDEELKIAKANLRAWNYWGKTWQEEKGPIASHNLELIKSREITYLKAYFELSTVLGGLENKNVLDVGCGTSEYHKWSVISGAQVVGVDISIEMIKLGRGRAKGINHVVADALNLPFKDGAFDVSMTFQALHHFPDWKQALAEMLRTSRAIVVYEPNRDSFLHRLMHLIRLIFRIERRFKEIDEDYKLVEPFAVGFSSKVLVRFLEEQGLKCKVLMSGILPVSLLRMFYKLSPSIAFYILMVENLTRKIPILQSQLGGFLLVGWKTNSTSECSH
ncbi:MAG: methyltransferase domain-containing protein [Candidatus Bathyarchaeia archaeon]